MTEPEREEGISDANQARLFIGQTDANVRNALWPTLSEEAQRLVMKIGQVLPVEGLDPNIAADMEELERQEKERKRARDIASENRARELSQEIAEEHQKREVASRVNELFAEMLNSVRLDDIPDLVPVVDGLLYRGTVARMNGKPGAMKSFVALDIAGHVAAGVPWCGRDVASGTVVYLVAEGAGGIRKRVRAWEQEKKATMRALFLPRPVQAQGAEWLVLEEACRLLRPCLVVIDTQARSTVGIDENSTKDMTAIFARIERLAKESDACVLLIHHLGHSGSHGRGSSAVLGAVQTEIVVEKKGKGAERVIVIQGSKSKDDDDDYEIRLLPRVVDVQGLRKPSGLLQTSVVLSPENREVLCIPGLSPEETATVRLLDKHGAPVDLGRDKIKKWLMEREIMPGRDYTLSRALRFRRDREKASGPSPDTSGAELVPLPADDDD